MNLFLMGGLYTLNTRAGVQIEWLSQVDRSWLTKDIWKPALEAAGVEYRPLKQAMHTYAIMHLSKGEDPLAIAKTLGHCDTTMLEKVYTKYKEKIVGVSVGEEDVVLNDADYGLDGLVDLAGSDAFDVNKSSQKETGIWAGFWAKNKKRISKFIANPLKSLVGRVGIEPTTY
ncbi:MAG: hypothetical protein WAK95_13570 [Desulfobacterales bacterium]